jgi:molybdopterin molybdotransferase
VPVAEHARRVAALVAPTPVVHRPPAECSGRALAEPVRSVTDLPRFDTSAMDGFAVRAADAPAVLPVTGTVAAGARHLPVLARGTAVRIMTGAPLPPGADAVVPVERVRSTADLVELPAVAPGAHVRCRGEDVAAGDVVLPAGAVLGPGRIAAALAAGAGTVAVHRPIEVLVLSAGSELAAPGEPCGPGRVPDTNGAMLRAAVVAAGGTARQLPLVPDRPDDLARLLLPALAGVDLLLTSGGISAGDHEVVKDVLGPAGAEFLRVALKPGGPQGLGRVGGVPVVCLPGNPVACWVSFELFVRPALRAAMGLGPPPPPPPPPPDHTPTPPPRRHEYVPARRTDDGDVEPVRGPGSHSYRALADADCLAELDGPRAGGATVRVLDLPT